METVTAKTKKKRSRITIFVVVVSILLLAGIAALLWLQYSTVPPILIRYDPSGEKHCNVHYLTAKDAEETREMLEERAHHDLWLKDNIRKEPDPDYRICFDRQVFSIWVVMKMDEEEKEEVRYVACECSDLHPDGKNEYQDTYFITNHEHKPYLTNLLQKYETMGASGQKDAPVDPEILIADGSYCTMDMSRWDAVAFQTLLNKKDGWNPHQASSDSRSAPYEICLGDGLYRFFADEDDYLLPGTGFAYYHISAGDPEYIATYDVDPENMEKIWDLLVKYTKPHMGWHINY